MVEIHYVVSWYPLQVIYPFEEYLFHIRIVHQVLHGRMSSERDLLNNTCANSQIYETAFTISSNFMSTLVPFAQGIP